MLLDMKDSLLVVRNSSWNAYW